jgi:hypothetical protein
MTAIWAWRFSVSRGWQWIRERDCDEESAAQWLAVFQRDEPGIEFRVATRKPTRKPN